MTTPGPQYSFWNLRSLRLANGLLLGLLFACVTYPITLLVGQVLPEVSTRYWSIAGALAAIESYRTSIKMTKREPFSPGSIQYHLVEWVVILVLLKLFTYLADPALNLWQDLPGWRENFLGRFFSGQFAAVVVMFVINYSLAGALAGSLLVLENDEDLLTGEKTGFRGPDRKQAYSQLTGLIFIIGGGMLVLATLLNIQWKDWVPVRPKAFILTSYFMVGFVLLALARYTMKEAHWFLQDIPADTKIGRLWLVSSALILGVVGLVVSFLPTSYSVGLFEVLQRLFAGLVKIVVLVVGFLLTPLLMLYAFLASLLGVPAASPELLATPTPTPTPAVVPTPLPSAVPQPGWVSDVKAVAFWGVLITVTIISFRLFIIYNQVHLGGIVALGKFTWLKSGWAWLKGVVKRGGQQVALLAAAGLQRVRHTLRQGRVLFEHPFEVISGTFPPRQRVVLQYLALARALDAFGLGRARAETPHGYARRVGQALPEVEPDFGEVSRVFVEARYSHHPVEDAQAQQVQQAVARIRAVLDRVREENEKNAASSAIGEDLTTPRD